MKRRFIRCFDEGIFEVTKTTGKKAAAEMPEGAKNILEAFNAGLHVDEAAQELGISEAKAWQDCDTLYKRLRVHGSPAALVMGRLVGLLGT